MLTPLSRREVRPKLLGPQLAEGRTETGKTGTVRPHRTFDKHVRDPSEPNRRQTLTRRLKRLREELAALASWRSNRTPRPPGWRGRWPGRSCPTRRTTVGNWRGAAVTKRWKVVRVERAVETKADGPRAHAELILPCGHV